MNIEIIKNRKGAQKAVDIPSEVLSLLNTGSIETVNLTEWLAIDHSQNTIRLIGALLYEKYANTDLYDPLFKQLIHLIPNHRRRR